MDGGGAGGEQLQRAAAHDAPHHRLHPHADGGVQEEESKGGSA